MRRALLLVVSLSFCPAAIAARETEPNVLGGVVALMIVQDRAGDDRAVEDVEHALLQELIGRADLVEPEHTRSFLRRLRIRNGDEAPPDRLQRLAGELHADWLVSATVHLAERQDVPRLSLSARVYQGATGELFWVGFHGATGLDTSGILGLGRIWDMETLIPTVVRQLLADLGDQPARKASKLDASCAALGKMAIIPFASITESRGTFAADMVTEATRAVVYRQGVRLVSPGCVSDVLRRRRQVRWGEVDGGTRVALRSACGADSILTGMVERYDVNMARLQPDPDAEIALRLVSMDDGKILWLGALDRQGSQSRGLFRAGRIYSLGALTEKMLESLTRRLLRERGRTLERGEGKE